MDRPRRLLECVGDLGYGEEIAEIGNRSHDGEVTLLRNLPQLPRCDSFGNLAQEPVIAYLRNMSTQRYERGIVPEWSLGDRLRKARSLTGMTAAEFASAIGVSERTINNGENDKRGVRKITLNAWALATGVSVEWLETGNGSPMPPPPGQGTPELHRLTEQKRRRTRSGRATEGYAIPALATAA